jgi:hypothetical protein
VFRRRGEVFFSLAKPQSRKEKRRFSPAARPRLPIYFLGERPEGFEDVPILEPLKGTNWRQKAEAIRLLLQLGVSKAEIVQKLGLSEEDIQRT